MNAMKRVVLAAAMIGLATSAAMADGMIVPIRQDIRVVGNWAVKYHHVKMTVRDQVASVSIDQEFVNTGSGMIEVEYLFPVPPDAAIDSMTLSVDGKDMAATLMKADEARKIYEDIVRKKKDPALLEYAGFGMYRTKAFPLEPNKPAKVIITYKSVCKKDNGLVSVWYPLNTEKFSAKAIESVEVKVDIKTDTDITTVYSPTHDLNVERKGPRQVIATYSAKGTLPTNDFQLYYKAADEAIGATLLTHQGDSKSDGYFMMLASPNLRTAAKAVTAKDVVLVLDRSGSMSGEKIDQVKDAVRFVLKNLNKEDRFNIIMFSDSVEPLSDKLQEATEKNVEAALKALDHVDASGGTNTYDALQAAMKQWPVDETTKKADDPDLVAARGARPKYILFLTDGLPTVGKTAEKDILEDAAKSNLCGARIFGFGVGYDVNVRLMDKLTGDNKGKSDYVKPKESVEGHISSLYSKIKNPVMTNLTMEIKGVKIRDSYPKQLGDLFEGDQLVVAGRYYLTDEARNRLSIQGRAAGTPFSTQLVIKGTYEGKEKAFEYPVSVAVEPTGSTYNFIEKIWAMRRIGFLLDQIQLHGDNKELIDELVGLSKQYGIITPYTSFLADETTALGKDGDMRKLAQGAADKLQSEVAGEAGQRHAQNRGGLGDATVVAGPAAAPSSSSGLPGGDTGRPKGTSVVGYEDKEQHEGGKKARELETVRTAENQAIYKRGDVWATPEAAKLDVQKEADKIKTIERFSKEYFDLSAKNTAAENKLLALQGEGEQLLIILRGQAYLIK